MTMFNIDKRFIEVLNEMTGSSITYSQFSEAYSVRKSERPQKVYCSKCGNTLKTHESRCGLCGFLSALNLEQSK